MNLFILKQQEFCFPSEKCKANSICEEHFWQMKLYLKVLVFFIILAHSWVFQSNFPAFLFLFKVFFCQYIIKCDKLNNDLEPLSQIDTSECYPIFEASEIRVSALKTPSKILLETNSLTCKLRAFSLQKHVKKTIKRAAERMKRDTIEIKTIDHCLKGFSISKFMLNSSINTNILAP